MTTYYLQLRLIHRLIIGAILICSLLSLNYGPRFQANYQALQQTTLQLKNSRQKLLQQNTILLNSTNYHQELQALTDRQKNFNFDTVKQSLDNLNTPKAYWQDTSTMQATLNLQGDFSQLTKQWQILINEVIPWQLTNYEIQSHDQTLLCTLHFSNNQNIANIETIDKNPFTQTSYDNPIIKTPQDLQWFGALKINNFFTAFAQLPNKHIKSYTMNDIIGDEQWQIIDISFKKIIFKNAAQQNLTIPFNSAKNQTL